METWSWINKFMIQLQNRHFRGYGVYGLQGSAKPSGNSHGHYQHNRCVVANILRVTPSQNNNDPGCHRWCRGPSCCSHQVRIVFYRHPRYLIIAKFTIFWWSLVITISWWWSLFVARWKSACNKLWNTTDGGPCFWRPMRQDCETVPRHLKFREKKKDLFKGRIVMILGCISKEGGGRGQTRFEQRYKKL